MHRIKQYFNNSTIHGLHYITETERHWTERFFWIGACCLSGYYTWFYITATWFAFQNNAVSFVVETDYLDWNTTFPAITVCEQESPDKLYDAANEFSSTWHIKRALSLTVEITCTGAFRLFGEDRDMNMDFFLRDIAFFDGACYSCSVHCVNGGMNCTENFDALVEKIRVKCYELIEKCVWNGEDFDCCDNFLPLPTEHGLCFSFNSMHTKKKKNTLSGLVSNRKLGPGTLELNAFESIKIYIHSREDVPYVNHPQDEKALLNWGSTYTMKIKVKEINNDRNLPLVDVTQRNCRLPVENNLDVYNYYSYSSCVVNCRALAQMKLCNCTSHFVPYKDEASRKEICGIKGLICLTRHSGICPFKYMLRTLYEDDMRAIGVECACVSSCTEPEYNIISSDVQMHPRNSGIQYGSRVIIALDKLPIERYKRNVVRTRLDLVVSVGGTVGLFLGASILSVIELVYYMFIRMHSFDLKEIQNIKHTRKESSLRNTIQLTSQLILPNFRRFRKS